MAEHRSLKNQLYNAVLRGDLENTKQITNYLTRFRPWHPGNDLLCAALVYKHLDIARYFLSQGCEVVGNRRNHGGYTALHLAVLCGDSTIVKMILRKDAFFDSINLEGMTALHLVVYRNHDKHGRFLSPEIFDQESSIILDILLQRGSCINTPVTSKGKDRYTALHLAAECGNENIIPILLDRKADLNIVACGGLTPLHIAAIHGRVGIVKLFLDHGAIAFARDAKGKSPLRWAMEKRHMDIVEVFINYEPPPSQRSYTNLPKLLDDKYVLLSAIQLDNVSIVQSLLCKGVLVQSAWGNGETALHVAIRRGMEDIVKVLLDHGANLRAVAKDGKTPLYLAVEIGVVRVVEVLLKKISHTDSMIFLTGPSKCTPLHVAVMSDREEIVRLLLLRGTDVYRKILAHRSPQMLSESLLHIAAKNGSLPICKLLLNYGADIDSKDLKGRNAIYFAAERGNCQVVDELCDISLQQKPKEKSWTEGYAALYVAACYGNDEIVNLLLKKEIDLKANILGYSTPLHAAVERNHDKIVKSLLENGFDVNERRLDGRDGRTALHCAVEKGFYTIVDIILQKGADVNAKIIESNKAEYTPLHCAAEMGNLKIVKLLLQKDADVNAKTESNHTPLFLAVLKNHDDVVQYLVNYGANTNVFGNKDRKTERLFLNYCIDNDVLQTSFRPLSFAVFRHNERIIEILLKHGAAVDMKTEKIFPLHLAVGYANGKILGKLLQHGAKINSKCTRGYTPLSHAVHGGHIETIKHLIKKGAYLRTKTKNDNSLLHIAVESPYRNKKLIKILLECGLDVNARNQHQRTPLHCCYIKDDKTDKDSNLFEYLLDYGAEVNAQDDVGNTPLHVAVSNSNIKSVKVLLEYGADINAVNHKGNIALENILAFDDESEEYLLYEIEESIAKLFIKIIVIRKAVGLYLSEKYLQLITREEIEYYYQNCKKEFDKTVCKEICKNVSFSDILTKNTNKLDVYFRNQAIIDVLKSTDVRKLFPIYAPLFGARIRKAKERKVLLESSGKYLKSILKFEFPSLIVQHIFSFLSSVELKNMSRVFQRPPRFVPKRRN